MDEGFIKADFHIHTPESHCYEDYAATAEQLVDAAVSAGLDAIAVTDHNTARAIDSIRSPGQNRGLAVFPGVELSTTAGHVIALFAPETPVRMLDDFLDYVGATPVSRGNGAVFVHDWIEDVFQKIDERGGIAIAAHIERWPTGFLQSTEPRVVKRRIHANPYLTALEITQPHNKTLWNNGEMPDYPQGRPCIQSSDAHALAEIGRRATYLRLPSPDLTGLRAAFNDYESRIRFPEELDARS